MFIQTSSLPNLCEVSIFKATMHVSRKKREKYLFLLNKLPWQPPQLAFSGLKIFHSIFIIGGRGKGRKKPHESLYCKNSCQNTYYPIRNLPGIFPNLLNLTCLTHECLTNSIFMKRKHVHSLRSWKKQCSQFMKGCSYEQLHYCLTS